MGQTIDVGHPDQRCPEVGRDIIAAGIHGYGPNNSATASWCLAHRRVTITTDGDLFDFDAAIRALAALKAEADRVPRHFGPR